MAKLTVTTFVTLDGVMQAPGGPTEDTSGSFKSGGWVTPFVEDKFGDFMIDVFAKGGAYLLGRKTYEIFASYWPSHNDLKDPIAVALNSLPKYVASRTLDKVEWNNSTLVRDVGREVARLKQELDRDLQVHGSGGLVQTLFESDLVDELNLLVFPVVLGRGKRLFASGTIPTAYELTSLRTSSRGVVISTLKRAGRPTYGTVGQ